MNEAADMNEGADLLQEPVQVCLLAGKIMLQSGAETYRVEDTMNRMASALGLPRSHSYVTPTGIVFQSGETESAKLIRIVERTTDLQKVADVNDVSRKLAGGALTCAEARARLLEIEVGINAYPVALQIAAAALSSGCFTLMFRGGLSDFIPGVLCGGAGFAAFLLFHRLVKVKFFAEFTASLLIGLLAALLVTLGLGRELDKIIIGSVMPLVPGLLITNAVRDLMAGHLVSGLSRGAEAFLTAFAIGAGIAVMFTLF
ncbi:threonine/serine exporter family protein [Paenibacillus macerans]|nr:threonine/serine exporter family protein [Paenibacillus macerans]MCM3700058.1 threonine/serine exporter family protein [Paenibacillus macerans]